MHDVNGGMLYGHNDLVMEFNEFYEAGYEMGDWNVCYNGADKAKYRRAVREKYQNIDVGGGKYDLDLINQRYGPPAYLDAKSG